MSTSPKLNLGYGGVLNTKQTDFFGQTDINTGNADPNPAFQSTQQFIQQPQQYQQQPQQPQQSPFEDPVIFPAKTKQEEELLKKFIVSQESGKRPEVALYEKDGKMYIKLEMELTEE